RRRHTIFSRDWSSYVCSSDLVLPARGEAHPHIPRNAHIESPRRLGQRQLVVGGHRKTVQGRSGQVGLAPFKSVSHGKPHHFPRYIPTGRTSGGKSAAQARSQPPCSSA